MGRFLGNRNIHLGPKLRVVLCLCAITFWGRASVYAQINTLPAPQSTPSSSMQNTLNEVRERGSILIAPEMIKSILQENNFHITTERSVQGDISGYVLVAVTENVPVIFLFTACASDGCMFMEILHLMNTSKQGMLFTTSMVNSLNETLPYGTFTSEDNGDLMVRADSIAKPLCTARCLESDIGAYLGMVSGMYELVQSLLQSQTADAKNGIPPNAHPIEQAFAASLSVWQPSPATSISTAMNATGWQALSLVSTAALSSEDVFKKAHKDEIKLLSVLSQKPYYARFFKPEIDSTLGGSDIEGFGNIEDTVEGEVSFPNLFPTQD